MNYFAAALVYCAFAAVIVAAIFVTQSAWPLLGLLLTPSISFKED